MEKLLISKEKSFYRIVYYSIHTANAISDLNKACMCMQNTAGVDLTNILTQSFCTRRSRKRKKTDNVTVFFTLLGSGSAKASSNTLMKLTPDCRVLFFGK